MNALEEQIGEGQSHIGPSLFAYVPCNGRIDPWHTEMIFASYFAGCAARVVQLAFSTVVQHFGGTGAISRFGVGYRFDSPASS